MDDVCVLIVKIVKLQCFLLHSQKLRRGFSVKSNSEHLGPTAPRREGGSIQNTQSPQLHRGGMGDLATPAPAPLPPPHAPRMRWVGRVGAGFKNLA